MPIITRKPLISFVIPAYNRTELLRATLDSVLHQTIKQLEIILVDNGSTPPLSTQLNNISQVKLIRLTANKGPSFARNLGAKAALGQYICFLDSDDLLEPNFCAEMIKSLQQFQTPVVCLSKTSFTVDYPWQKKLLQIFINWLRNLGLSISFFVNDGKLIREAFFAVTLSRLVIPSTLLKNLAFNNQMSSCEDWDFVIKLFDRSQIYILPSTLVYFKFSKRSLSETGRQADNWQSYDQVIKTLPLSSQRHPLVVGFKWYKELGSHWL